MGCDIHEYMEVVYNINPGRPYTDSIGKIDIGRNYLLFSIMADVRGEGPAVVEPRGIPRNLGHHAANEYYLFVDDKPAVGSDYSCSTDQANKWISGGYSNWEDDRKIRISNPDWHSASWLTVSELEEVQRRYSETMVEDYDVQNNRWTSLLQEGLTQEQIEAARQHLRENPPMKKAGLYIPLEATIAALKCYQKPGYEPRLVFWFDN